MKKPKKKFPSVIIGILLVIGMALAGCGESNPGNSSSEEGSSSKDQELGISKVDFDLDVFNREWAAWEEQGIASYSFGENYTEIDPPSPYDGSYRSRLVINNNLVGAVDIALEEYRRRSPVGTFSDLYKWISSYQKAFESPHLSRSSPIQIRYNAQYHYPEYVSFSYHHSNYSGTGEETFGDVECIVEYSDFNIVDDSMTCGRHEGLSVETELRIIQDYRNRFYEHNGIVWILQYYGTYNGCIVVRIDTSDAAYLDENPTIIVADTLIRYYGPMIITWKEGQFYQLEEAYDQGLLTREDIQSIANIPLRPQENVVTILSSSK